MKKTEYLCNLYEEWIIDYQDIVRAGLLSFFYRDLMRDLAFLQGWDVGRVLGIVDVPETNNVPMSESNFCGE